MTTIDDPGTLRIARDTHLVRFVLRGDAVPIAVHCNSLVIAGAEPTLVDVGPAIVRDRWLERVGSVVDLADVRWVFLTHDEPDHAGNVDVVVDLCPRATVVTTWVGGARRLAAGQELPAHRQRWVRAGEGFDAGDRRLVAIRPPLYDAPETRGLHDPTTGVYWASDAFGIVVDPAGDPPADLVDDVGELDAGSWAEGFVRAASWLSPWHALVAADRWQRELETFRSVAPTAIASAHGPWIRGSHVDAAIGLLSRLGTRPPVPGPGPDVLAAVLENHSRAPTTHG